MYNIKGSIEITSWSWIRILG